MAVEIKPRSWGPNGAAIVVSTMHETSKVKEAREAYLSLTITQKALYESKLSEEKVTTLRQIIAATTAPPPRVVVAIAPTPTPTRLNRATTSSENGFKNWIIQQATLVDQSSGLAWSFYGKETLNDGTKAVGICIRKDSHRVGGTDFVFHYHPGIKGARPGHGEASKGHFKPTHGSGIRAKDYFFTSGTAAAKFYRDAKRAAR